MDKKEQKRHKEIYQEKWLKRDNIDLGCIIVDSKKKQTLMIN